MKVPQDIQIILASKSPRRLQLLQEAGFKVKQVFIQTDESWTSEIPVSDLASHIAEKKLNQAIDQIILQSNEVLLVADSIVVLNNDVLEKPKNEVEAKYMLNALSNQWHEVHTGFCVFYQGHSIISTVKSEVKMGLLQPDEIEYYINYYKPYDKAGSYGIQEWIGHCKIEKIVGSYTNIVGLPMFEVYQAVQSFFDNK